MPVNIRQAVAIKLLCDIIQCSLLIAAIILTSCDSLICQANDFVDSSSLKPSILLISPQSFKVPVNNVQQGETNGDRLQQYVAVINNIQNERDNQLLRQQYRRLTLQVRDAKTPITGQLFYEHVFDYFSPNPQEQHLLIPINLDHVSPIQEQLTPASARSYAAILTGNDATTLSRPQHLIISIRPYQLQSGFGSDSIEFVSSSPIPVEAVRSSDGLRSFAIVQTDKPVYKPEDKVLIRSLVINENLKPVIRDELRLQVRNPHKIIVEETRFPNVNSESEAAATNKEPLFLDHVFEFPPEPMLGTWSVHLLHGDPIANDTTSFEVKEYVLPTYEIEFESPKYILPNTQHLVGSIVAKYHYGKPVLGKAQIKFGYKEAHAAKPKYIARSSIQNVNPTTGRVDYKIGSDKFKDINWFPGISGSRLVIEATVTEMSTGHRETAQDTSCVFMNSPYKISFEDSIEDFKPGLNQQLTVQVLEVRTNQPAPAGSRIIAQYRDQSGSYLNTTSPAMKNKRSIDSKQLLDGEAYTDSRGRASFNIGPLPSEITSILVTIRYINSTQVKDAAGLPAQFDMNSSKLPATPGADLALGYHTLTRHDSHNGWISLMNKTITQLNIGDQFVSDILIRDAVIIPQKIFYLIVARGQILALDMLDQQGLVKFSITEAMVPSARIVLFALTHDSVGFLSDSMRLNVGQDLNCGLKMRYKSNGALDSRANITTVRPSDRGRLAIQARQGDLISLIGVDSAVYTLNNRSRLESSRVVERIKKLDTGCGFGGGKNNLDVFHNSGLMFFKDVAHDQVNDSLASHLGSSCLTLQNQLRHLEDMQLGYSRPIFSAAAQITKPRSLELAAALRQRVSANSPELPHRLTRSKREVDIESILKRYKDVFHRSCCRLGTLEDLPQRRNCSVRARIVEKHMRPVQFRVCSMIYYDCCRSVFGEHLLLSSVLNARDQGEPQVEMRKIPVSQSAPQYSEAVLTNVGHLDRIETETLVRKDFRETWLFDLVKIEEADGSGSHEIQLPHSITTWSISALALNRYRPMCMMERPLKITTFQDIFLQISMPYKVVQGEQIDLVATVFNYSPQSQEVLVYMYGIEDVCSEAEPGERSDRKRVRLEKHSSQSVLFPMIPLKTGQYPIKILAITPLSGGSDIIERYLNVVPRGKPVTDETTFSLDPMNLQRRNKRAIHTGNLVDEIDSSRGLQRSKVRLTPSRDSEFIVPQTQECIVSAIGDKMGQSVQTTMIDVENLIRLPHGCGEQVMIYLGPTLYTTRYLSSINKLTGDLRWRAIRYIQSGYKRILNYRKESGAFSAFPRRDPSIWLTAFIAKMLCQTERTPFVADEIHVDRTVVNSALNWLVDMQNKDFGTWVELNPVYHREMLGGVLRENLLTAFVTVTLNECAHHSPDLTEETEIEDGDSSIRETGRMHVHSNGVDKLKMSVQRAEQALMLDRYKAVKERNPYVLALTAYALSFTKPRDAAAVLTDLMYFAERSQSRNQVYWRGDYQIETAAYALQALIELAPILVSNSAAGSPPINNQRSSTWLPGADAVAISNWLTSRRSYSGAFESTQDTVVALEALSKFAQLQATPNGNSLIPTSSNLPSSLTCNVTINNRTRRSIEFGSNNAQILQTIKLESFDFDPLSGEMLDVITSGNGLGTMSVKLKYNVFQEEDELCRFNIDSFIEEWQPKIALSNNPENRDDQDMGQPREDSKETENPPANETIEDDYFKTFDKLMLSELNLVDLNQLDSNGNHETRTNRRSGGGSEPKKEILRTRRYASHMMDLSSKNRNSTGSTNESWTTKMVSTIRAKLPTWLVPKPTTAPTTTTMTTTSTTTSPTPSVAPNTRSDVLSSLNDTHTYLSDATPRGRTNTSRRSTQSLGIPMISVPSTSIPAGAKLNALSKQLDFNDTSNGNTTNSHLLATQQKIANSSNRLVLLLRVCVHHMSSRRDSEMAVIEVGILSGFKPNEADLTEIINDAGTPAMKFEISADRSMVVIYMRYIPFSGPYCLQFRLIRDSLVYNLQSGYIRVYEYYSPAHSCSDFYTPTRVTDLIETKCDSSGQVCQCASKSMCPATNKLLDLGEIHSVNSTRARNQLMDLVCSSRFDLVSLVRLKSVRHLGPGKMFKLAVKVKSDLKGNLTKIIEMQRQQRTNSPYSVTKPQYMAPSTLGAEYVSPSGSASSESDVGPVDRESEEETSLDYLNLSIDSSCVRNDPLLLHLAHPNQWKQGGELMILFGRYANLEKRFFKTTTTKSSSTSRAPLTQALRTSSTGHNDGGPGVGQETTSGKSDSKLNEVVARMAPATLFDDAQRLQYSTTMLLDKSSILHDVAYQARVEPRETINSLILWLELRSRREKWSCPQPATTTPA